ncbi:FtsX-like permease family protein [Amycolatopsis xylanica]|uniref:FtsX-like permease family protein n=1 Tax=Amycolatopsis xylanica TaxID=589385 RepID=A0A1H3AIZ7_9PSEU|nr:FtsX-like permease family protein [Amycolatopsis xylanica]SDX29318.1 FtsX-like permease family protein [Amycolatopsis xylanica]
MNSFQLAMRVLRVDRRTRTSAILTAVGVAIATALVLLLVALPFATKARDTRAVWQEKDYGSASTTEGHLLFAKSVDYVNGKKFVRVDVALKDGWTTVDLPPGVPKFPAPGETIVSPGLGRLIHDLPLSQLGDRFGPQLAGALGDEALRFPEQLVALVGHTPDTMPKSATAVAGFKHGAASADPMLTLLAGVGVIVLMVPSLVLVGSSTRLTAARREQRLAAFRLAGATPGQVTKIVAAEMALSALGGAALGLLLSPALHGLATFVPWDGGTWQASDFSLPIGVTVALIAGLVSLVLLAAVISMRRVLSTPIGAAASHARKPLHWWRLLALPAAGAVFLIAIITAKDAGGPEFIFLGLALLVGSAALVGPWVTSGVGGTFVRGWRKPSSLLAGRRLRDDPKGAYRASAGVVLAVFTGSMALTLLPSFESLAGGGRSFQDSVLYVDVNPDEASQIVEKTNAALVKYGQSERAVAVPLVYVATADGTKRSALVIECARIEELTRFKVQGGCDGSAGLFSTYPAKVENAKVSGDPEKQGVPFAAAATAKTVTATDTNMWQSLIIDPALVPKDLPLGQYSQVTVAVPGTGNREVVRTALAGAAGGTQVDSREGKLDRQQTELDDLRRVTVIGLIVAAMLAGASAAVATAGSVMDRRRTFGALIAAGTPVSVLSRALRMEAALPAMVATIGAGVIGTLVGVGLFSLANEGPVVLSPWLAAPIVLGVGVALLAASVCTPALKRVRAEPLADE